MEESGRVLGNSRIRASIEKLYRGVPEKGRISVSTEKVSRLIPDKGQISVTTEKW